MMKKKKILSFALAVIMVASAIVVPQLMLASSTTGECGEGTHWSIDTEKGILYISGEGEVVFSQEEAPAWKSDFADSIKEVVVGDGITALCDNAFSDLPLLKTISLGSNMQSIPTAMCMNDKELEEVIIDAELISIGDLAFFGCEKMVCFDIPETVKNIGRSILNGTSITNIKIDANLDTAGNSFGGGFDISGLTEVTLGENVVKIPAYAFYNAVSLEKITFGKEIEEIGECAFSGCTSLMNFDMGSAVKKIGRNAFSDTAVTSIVIDSELEVCGDEFASAFASSQIKQVTFSENVASVPRYVLKAADNVEKVCFLNKNCIIPDYEDSIENSIVIYGCYVSSAKDYSQKYDRKFVAICPTGTHKNDTETFAPTCTEQGYDLVTCSECGLSYKINFSQALGHDMKWVVSIVPTYDQNGLNELKCEVCGYVMTYQEIPKLERPTASTTTTASATTTGTATQPSSNGANASHRETTRWPWHTSYTVTKPVSETAAQPINNLTYEGFRVVPGEASLKVAWLNDLRLSGYNIYISEDAKKYKKIATVKQSNEKSYYIVSGLDYNKIYYVKLAAYVGENTECKSSSVFVVKTK